MSDRFPLILCLLFLIQPCLVHGIRLYLLYSFLSPTFILIHWFSVSHSHTLALHSDSGCTRLPVNNCEKGRNREETEIDFVDSVPG